MPKTKKRVKPVKRATELGRELAGMREPVEVWDRMSLTNSTYSGEAGDGLRLECDGDGGGYLHFVREGVIVETVTVTAAKLKGR